MVSGAKMGHREMDSCALHSDVLLFFSEPARKFPFKCTFCKMLLM